MALGDWEVRSTWRGPARTQALAIGPMLWHRATWRGWRNHQSQENEDVKEDIRALGMLKQDVSVYHSKSNKNYLSTTLHSSLIASTPALANESIFLYFYASLGVSIERQLPARYACARAKHCPLQSLPRQGHA